MAKYEVLSTTATHQFPDRLYEIMPDDHFWVRSRFRVFLQETQKLGIDLTRLGQPDGISPSRMAEMLEVDKAGPKVRC